MALEVQERQSRGSEIENDKKKKEDIFQSQLEWASENS